MDGDTIEELRRVVDRVGLEAAIDVLFQRVRSSLAPRLSGADELLAGALALDWGNPERRVEHLARTSAAVEGWMDAGEIDAAFAVQQVVALRDPVAVSRETLLAAAIESAALAHAVATTGASDPAITARWEREMLDALRASAT